MSGRILLGLPGCQQSLFAGAGVGYAGIGHDSADVVAILGQCLPVQDNRRGRNLVSGKNGRSRAISLRIKQHQIQLARFLQAASSRPGRKALGAGYGTVCFCFYRQIRTSALSGRNPVGLSPSLYQR